MSQGSLGWDNEGYKRQRPYLTSVFLLVSVVAAQRAAFSSWQHRDTCPQQWGPLPSKENPD